MVQEEVNNKNLVQKLEKIEKGQAFNNILHIYTGVIEALN